MAEKKRIETALISVYHKEHLEPLLKQLDRCGVKIYSTGGTLSYLEEKGYKVISVESLTGYPSIFGGRVKTLHPKVLGGILHRRDIKEDLEEAIRYAVPTIDLVVVDLYPFEETVADGGTEAEIIEKIDIGGIALIRSAAKNHRDVLINASIDSFGEMVDILSAQDCATTMEQRRDFARRAFDVSSHYDTAIHNYFARESPDSAFKQSIGPTMELRYGENPHQRGFFHGDLEELFEKLNGKELSYNNLVDADAAINLIAEFGGETAFAVIKHTNACGLATASSAKEAYLKALAGDPVSAFGGVIVTNVKVDLETAQELNKLFFEILIAPAYDEEALSLLKSKKNRNILRQKTSLRVLRQHKTLLNGVISQDRDVHTETNDDLKCVTRRQPTYGELRALLFANRLAKHAKSNTVVLAREGQLLASGVGQTSRVDALKQAIDKASHFGFDLKGAVMASDAFFPFPDCVEIAHVSGIDLVIQPGGSIKDQLSIDKCDEQGGCMVMTGFRHFKH